MAADVSGPGAAERVVGAAVEHFGRLDILVNNSGGPPGGRFDDFDDAAWQRAFELLVLNVVRMVRAALPHLRSSGHGRIINVASTSVRQPIPGLLLSNSLRAAVAGLAKTLSDELAPDQVTVNTVLPGRILTDRLREGFAARAGALGVPVDQLARAEGPGRYPSAGWASRRTWAGSSPFSAPTPPLTSPARWWRWTAARSAVFSDRRFPVLNPERVDDDLEVVKVRRPSCREFRRRHPASG